MELETSRLFIRRLTPSDWTEMQEIIADFNQSTYVIYDVSLPSDAAEVKALTKAYADTNMFFAVFLPDSPKMLGYICFHKDNAQYDVGYCFRSSAHGHGYALESVSALMRYIREQDADAVFTAGTALDNIPSCNLLKKLGFECVGTETLSFHKDEAGNDISFRGGNFVCTDLK